MSENSTPKLTPQSRVALLMQDNVIGGTFGKMGFGLLRYSQAQIVAVVDTVTAGGDLVALTGIARPSPIVASVTEAAKLGADTLIIGVAPAGGILPDNFKNEILNGLDAGMSLVNGLHRRFADEDEFVSHLQPGRFIWDVRKEPDNLTNGSGRAATVSAKRVLTVGTDMAIGKMTVSLEMDKLARERGLRSRFLASGQIGICISGEGVALDAVRVDFASGSIEQLVLRHGNDHDILHVEGQGSLVHPASTAWLPLIRGSMPTHLILCHRAGQESIFRVPSVKIPPLPTVIALYEAVATAGGAFPSAKVAGIALNCGHLTESEAADAVKQTADETGLPTTDVIRFGAAPLLDAVMG